jgi:NAD+ kinase
VTAAEPTVRRVLLIAHVGRAEIREIARSYVKALTARGLVVRLVSDDIAALALGPGEVEPPIEVVSPGPNAGATCELVIVLGGDGSILRAAELTRADATPILGVNLGHVGFLAEAEPEELESTIDAVVGRRYTAEDRLTLDVSVRLDGRPMATTFALNETTVEKAARQRMIEVVVGIDGRPLSRWGCDGVVCATPTGSTAYSFSAGGPIVWPAVEALIVVPLSAHALFARPMVVAPASTVAIELVNKSEVPGVLCCDGRRTVDLPPGSRVEIRRASRPVRLVRLQAAPFSARLVAKFDLPVEGWRGAAERRRREVGPDDDRDPDQGRDTAGGTVD